MLKGVLVGLVSSSGCLTILNTGSHSNTPGPVTETEFTVYQPNDERFDEAPSVRDSPNITFDETNNRVVVTGKFFVGSSECDKAAFEDIQYSSDDRHLDITIGTEQRSDTGNSCTGGESLDAYRLIISFGNPLPDRVSVTEGSGASQHKASASR